MTHSKQRATVDAERRYLSVVPVIKANAPHVSSLL